MPDELRQFQITLRFTVRTMSKLTNEQFLEMMKSAFSDWREGRYPFDVEQITNGLTGVCSGEISMNDEVECWVG